MVVYPESEKKEIYKEYYGQLLRAQDITINEVIRLFEDGNQVSLHNFAKCAKEKLSFEFAYTQFLENELHEM
ncbi:MAG: hypothetical protein WC783_00220 [Candidatus Paceibacterota bacterium]|jgi:hypothetical protein